MLRSSAGIVIMKFELIIAPLLGYHNRHKTVLTTSKIPAKIHFDIHLISFMEVKSWTKKKCSILSKPSPIPTA